MSDIKLREWVAKYIPLEQERKARDIIDAKDWNDLFNLMRAQGNWNSEALEALINTGLLSAKHALYSDDTARLGGELPSYYAPRKDVIGTNEDVYRPGSTWAPTKPEHPTTKRYVDSALTEIRANMENRFAFFENKYENLFQEFETKYVNGVVILGKYKTFAEFIAVHPTGKAGDAYYVDGHIFIWDIQNDTWFDAGPLQGEQGAGSPAGGTTGQFLVKKTGNDFDTEWQTVPWDDYIKSSTSHRIFTGLKAPTSPQEGDIWLKG